MAVSNGVAQYIGKLLRNLRDPKWYAAEAAKMTTTIVVVNKAGHRVNAYLRAHLYHTEQDRNGQPTETHVGNVYRCESGHEYFHSNGSTSRFDPASNSWVSA